jgi:uncharacterized protein
VRPREQSRYGVPFGVNANGRYRWDRADNGADAYQRFDVSIKGGDATQDYRNEANCQGWIVEIDPRDPNSIPVKRTALGRFAHEGVVFAPPQQGQPLTFYMGDDAVNEYIYKFVTRARFNRNATISGDILDDGTHYLARFNEDGSGEVLALDINDPVFVAAAAEAGVEFKDQADVLVNTRLAADVAGATKVDRPEWGAVHPQTGEYGPALTDDNIFASPDGLWFDTNGLLWIQTDMSGNQQRNGPFGENAMLAANPLTGEVRRFLVGPREQEVTGVVNTPDNRTMFVNFQHPGDQSQPGSFTSNWPDNGAIYRHPGDPEVVVNPAGPRPRSSTIVITRVDGGVVGA